MCLNRKKGGQPEDGTYKRGASGSARERDKLEYNNAKYKRINVIKMGLNMIGSGRGSPFISALPS